MKKIRTDGIHYLETLEGSDAWYWGSDYTSGDLYEAEELFRDGHRIRKNRLIFVRRADGLVAEPVTAAEGQYFGRPVYDGGFVILLADFPAGELRLLRYDETTGAAAPIVTLPRAAVEDCYNLMPQRAPLTLTRQAGGRFQILWPERADFVIAPTESFDFREGDRLYFSRWYEDPDYREEIVVRTLGGEVAERYPGGLFTLPDGRTWALL